MGRRFDTGVLRRASLVLALSTLACTIFNAWEQEGAHHHRGSVGVAGAQPTEMPLAPAAAPAGQQEAGGGGGCEEGRWVEAVSADGRMTTAYMKMPGSRVLGLRGKAVVDHHISAILNVFLNTTMSTEWISYLDHVEEYATPKRNKHVIYQFFDMPWPLGDREFLMERAVETDKRARTVVAKYKSIDKHPAAGSKRPRKGKRGGKGGRGSVVRGEALHTQWVFRSLPPSKGLGGATPRTEIDVESQIDAKMPINGWLVSLMQESYQRASLAAMMELVAKAGPHAEYAHW